MAPSGPQPGRVPVPLAIRRTILERFNDPDVPFTNDQVLDSMRQSGMVETSVTVDDIEGDFAELCRAGAARNIAQNFTTIYLKLFAPLQAFGCERCGDIPLYEEEPRRCIMCDSPL